MDWLNYHHLLYFWTVAREGSIARATSILRLAQPTISTQLKSLERSMGQELFHREGRRLALTEAGRRVLRYADEIFRLGRDLVDAVNHGGPDSLPSPFEVGVAHVVPMLLVEVLLRPARSIMKTMRLVCREGTLPDLLAALSTGEIDVLLADQPADPSVKVKAFSHLLGECGVSFFSGKEFKSLRRSFPRSLDGAPFLLPGETTSTRRSLEQWFESKGMRPQILGEFDDVDLLQVFGRRGMGLFAAPSVLEQEICDQFEVIVIGRTDEIRERFYAISVERRLRHPAVIALTESARTRLFG